MSLQQLVQYLAEQSPSMASFEWRGWHISKVAGGMNNRLYRTRRPSTDLGPAERDFAIKFTIRDERDRAGREFAALSLLAGMNVMCVPRPVWLDRCEATPQHPPVVVQTWLAGEVLEAAPTLRSDWQKIVDHLHTIHAITPDLAQPIGIRPAVLTMTSAQAGRKAIAWQAARIPLTEQNAALRELLRQVDAITWPSWPEPALTLCRADTNIRNFIRPAAPADAWASVDWEYSGWGDPAFEIADLMCMPTYLEVPTAEWDWLLARYTADPSKAWTQDRDFALRVRIYRCLMYVWWVARLNRSLYEIPRQLDQRLVSSEPQTLVRYERHLQEYARRAERALSEL